MLSLLKLEMISLSQQFSKCLVKQSGTRNASAMLNITSKQLKQLSRVIPSESIDPLERRPTKQSLFGPQHPGSKIVYFSVNSNRLQVDLLPPRIYLYSSESHDDVKTFSRKIYENL